jgi:hypothetical protein
MSDGTDFDFRRIWYIRHPDSTMKKRVLIMSTSAGTGHVRAGEALTKVFEDHPRVGEVVHSDALRFTNKTSHGAAQTRPQMEAKGLGVRAMM